MKGKILAIAAALGMLLGAWSYMGMATASATETPTPVVSASASTSPEVVAKVGCHPAYKECLNPAHGDWDCSEIPDNKKPIHLKNKNVDPYDLDADGDGLGCEGPGVDPTPSTKAPTATPTKTPTTRAPTPRVTETQDSAPVDEELPRTGAKGLPIVLLGITLVGVGVTIFLFAARKGKRRSRPLR